MRRLALALALTAVCAAAAAGQMGPPPRPADLRPLIIDKRIPAAPVRRDLKPLTPEQVARLEEARSARASGMLARAKQILLPLNQQAPHHPLVVTELAEVYLAENGFAAVEKLARAERAALKDSLLLGRELSLALERLGRPREAAEAALEVWVAAPAEAEWASSTILRLAPTDARGVRTAVRKAVERLVNRPDLELGLARLEWQGGDLDAALRALAVADRAPQQPSSRSRFADERLLTGASRDTLAAIRSLVALAGDTARPSAERVQSSRRAWVLIARHGDDGTLAAQLGQALKDVGQWDADVLVGVARELRASGRTADARAVLSARGGDAALSHTVTLERALADLRDGPPEKALPALEAASHVSLEALARFADALFFAGLADSALGRYQEVAKQPQSPFAGAALERIYLIEDAEPRDALPTFGRMAYEEWRGETRVATAIAESLYRVLPHGPLWVQAAIALSAKREAAGDARAALEPVLAVADSLPGDRLAPVARQRAGDLYLTKLKDEPSALAQYEECLARYPRAWNSAEVRRRVEMLRRERRF